MHLHILGICGTFMGGIAAIAKSLGHQVTGSDANVYPPMSTQLEQLGITLTQGYDPAQLEPAPDLVIIGNAMSRGNPCVEYVLNRNIPYTSGPQWLAETVLRDRWVLAVSGTHGKTTTSTMLAWILEYAGLNPGFLIGGIPQNFDVSARLGAAPFFVIEADEYDTTSAARSIRLSLMPCAIAATVPVEQGQITMVRGAADPDATGENQSSLP